MLIKICLARQIFTLLSLEFVVRLERTLEVLGEPPCRRQSDESYEAQELSFPAPEEAGFLGRVPCTL